jgi:hypothetical protein
MFRPRRRTLFLGLVVALVSTRTALAAGKSDTGPSRVDFDERIIKGQRGTTGGIYIFARQTVTFKDMVQKPRSFRQRTIMTVFNE